MHVCGCSGMNISIKSRNFLLACHTWSTLEIMKATPKTPSNDSVLTEWDLLHVDPWVLGDCLYHSFVCHFSLVLSIKAMILEENVMFPILTDLPCQDQAQTSHGERGTINRVIVRTQWGMYFKTTWWNNLIDIYRYGFDFGCIHVVMMSTEHDYRNTSKQYSFLVSHFETINRTKTPWLIFSGHRSIVCTCL